jgi:lipoprotein NlpD
LPQQQGSRASLLPTYYKVKRGDTLYAIAWQAGRDFRELARWNRIASPYLIYPGQLIRTRRPPSPVGGGKSGARHATPVATSRPEGTPKPARRPAARSTPPAVQVAQSARKTTPSGARTARQKPGIKRLRWSWPGQGKLVSRFRSGDPLKQGIKLRADAGDPVKAAATGKVVYSGSGLIGYGRLIIVKHNDNYLSAYGHNRKLLAREGDQVTRGQQLAEMGTDSSGQPMLHFEIRRDGQPVDPLAVLPQR